MIETAALALTPKDVEQHVEGVDFRYARDHAVQDVAVLPGCAFITLVAGLDPDGPGRQGSFRNVRFHNVCPYSEAGSPDLLVAWEEAGEGRRSFRVYTAGAVGDEGILHASGAIERSAAGERNPGESAIPIESLVPDGSPAEAGDGFYARLRRNGNDYGPAFQGVADVHALPGEAWARLDLPAPGLPEAEATALHPASLDACLHALAAAHPVEGWTLVLQSIDTLRIHAPLGAAAWSHARITEVREASGASGRSTSGDVHVYDAQGRLLLEALGVRFDYHPFAEQPRGEAGTDDDRLFAVSATFTAEPIEPLLEFWASRLGIPGRVAFAPYNQVYQQLLDPNSLLAKNDRGANLLLIRLEDWLRFRHDLTPRVDPDRQSALLAGKKTFELPGGAQIAQIEAYETEYLFKEIFADGAYVRHGITLEDGDCVFDVGANIGLFSLFVESRCQNARIFAFEPSPAVYACLEPNLALYCGNATALNCGLSDVDKELPFTFYPRSSVFSSYRPDPEQDFDAVRAVVRNMLSSMGAQADDATEGDADEFMAGRLTPETVQCQFRSLSSVMREQGIERIDLLKIDVEKAELDVLRGLSDDDWPRIKQVVIEVHDAEGQVLAEVCRILEAQGFQLAVEEERLLEGSGLYNVYATRGRAAQDAEAARSFASTEAAALRDHAAELIESLKTAAERASAPILVALPAASPQRLADSEKSAIDREIHTLIADELRSLDRVQVITAEEIARHYPVAEHYDAHGDQLGHVPYTPEYFAALSSALARRLHLLTRPAHKVIVLDCDNTLWGGVCGEVGAEGVDVSGAYAALQRFMVDRHDDGMLLCLCSKNSEEDVLAVFEARADMPLREEHLAATRINWEAKSANILALAQELNVGLDSFIFVDDNPVECAEVRANLPEVLTLQLPAAEETPGLLDHLWAFDQLRSTDEDRKRTASYRLNVERNRLRAEAPSLKAFLDRLQLEVTIEPVGEEQLPRAAQLTQRTNQFNFTTRRRSEAEIRALAGRDDIEALAVSVRDRFGDYGFVGLAIARCGEDGLEVDTFLLSCRVLGRGVEHRVLVRLAEIACERSLPVVRLHWTATEKNRPAHDFLTAVGHDVLENGATAEAATAALPAERLLTLRYEPEDTAPSGADAPAADKSAAAREIGPERPSAADHGLYEAVAGELRDPEAVLARARSTQRKARAAEAGDLVEPKTDCEKAVARVWQDVLAVDRVGLHDHFFEIGGTSLKAVQVVSKIRRELGVTLATATLFDHTTVHDLAALLEGEEGGAWTA